MKKMKIAWITFMVIVLLCGCADKRANTLQGLTDPRGALPYKQNNFSDGYLETVFAGYYVKMTDMDGFIQVCAKGDTRFVPLCGKPNCPHKDMDCNAFCANSALGYYNDRLYAISYNAENSIVVSMLPDGSDRKELADIPRPVFSDGSSGGIYLYNFHENRLIIYCDPGAELPVEEQIIRLYIMDLETGQISEPFRDYITPSIRPGYEIQPVGSLLYEECDFRDPQGNVEIWWLEMNMDTGEVRKLFQVEKPYSSTITDGKFYYLIPGEGCMEYDLAADETVNRGLPIGDGLSENVDDDWIYIVTNADTSAVYGASEYTIHILNRSYEKVDEIYLGKNIRPRFVDEDRIYFNTWDDRSLQYYLDKSKIGTGKLEILPLP